MNVLLKKEDLLDENGELKQEGFCFEPILEYRKDYVKCPIYKLKEWDYYQIYNEHYALILSVSDLSTRGIFKVSYYNFDDQTIINKNYIIKRPYGSICMPTTSRFQDVKFEKRNFSFEFITDIYKRKLVVSMKNFFVDKEKKIKKDFYCVITLNEQIDGTSVTSRGFRNSRCFAYNQKINCMKVEGYFNIGEDKYYFYPSNTLASLDWMRCVLPDEKISYLQATMSGYTITKKEIGFNISTNYGNDTVNENMFFYDKKAYKLDDCEIDIPTDPFGNKLYKSIWTIRTNTINVNNEMDEEKNTPYKELFIEFSPILDYTEEVKEIGAIINDYKVYGKFNGYIYFDEKRIEFNNMIGSIDVIDLKM